VASHGLVTQVALSWLVTAPAVGASEDPVGVQWQAPAECPGATEVREEAVRRMGTSTRPVSADGVVTRDPTTGEYQLDLRLHHARGEETRRIRGTSCKALAEVAGLWVAIASEVAPAESEEVGTSATAVPQPPVLPPPAIAVAPSEPSVDGSKPQPLPTLPMARPRLPLRAGLRAFVAGEFLLLPQPAGLGFGGTLSLLGPRFRVELRGEYLLPESTAYANTPTTGGTIDLWTVGLSACYEPALRTVSFPICGGAVGGMVSGEAWGVAVPLEARDWLVGLRVDAGVMWSLLRYFALHVGVGALVPLRRPAFHVRDLGELYRVREFGLSLTAGAEVRFP